MQERWQQWPPKIKLNKWWVMGAIAIPVFLGIVGWSRLLPERRLPTDDDRLSHNESANLADPHPAAAISSIGAIAVVAGVFLFLNFRNASGDVETANLNGADLCGADLNGADLCGVDLNQANLCNAHLTGADLCGTELNGANLCGVDLSQANLSGANLISANLQGANLQGAVLRYANLSGADLRYTNLSGADLRYANLSGADLNCALVSDANLSDANLSGALLFFINSREVQNLEPLQLEAQPSPFLCNVALPAYSHQPRVNPDRDCYRIPHLLSARYDISLEEAQGIVDEARQHRWA